MPIISLLEISPLVIAALHLPDFAANRRLSMAWLEDYVLGNARIFAEASISAFKLLDESREPGAVETVALARMIRREFPATASRNPWRGSAPRGKAGYAARSSSAAA